MSRDIRRYIDILRESSEMPADRLMHRVRALGQSGGKFDMVADDGHTVVLETLEAEQFRTGWGTRFMNMLIEIADEEGVVLKLKPQALHDYENDPHYDAAMNQNTLEAWYEKFGFSFYPDPSRDDGMEYSEYMRRAPHIN